MSVLTRILLLALTTTLFGAGTMHAVPSRLGDVDEDGIPTIHDVVMMLNHIHGRIRFAEDRVSFADLNRDGLVNSQDVDEVANAVVAGLALAEIDFNPSLGASVPYTSLDQFTFSGTNFPRTQIQISHPFGTTQVQSDSSGAFSVDLPLGSNRSQDFYLAGFDAQGARLPLIPVRVLQDSEGPELEVTFPPSNWTTSRDSVVVCGRLSDLLSGYLGMGVDVGGESASVFVGDGLKGSFISGPVALSLGQNTLQIRGTDAAGNSSLHEVTVTRIPEDGFRLAKVSGDLQEASVRSFLGEPVGAKLLGPGGEALAGKPVLFEVVDGLGTISPVGGASEGTRLSVVTDSNGVAQVSWRMSTVAGKGNHLLRAQSRDIAGDLVFIASATPNSSVRLHLVEGDGQVGAVGTLARRPLRVWVSDGGNALSGQPVQFTVNSGGGKVNGEDSTTVSSGAAGFAELRFRLGNTPGPQQISVQVVGETGTASSFFVTGIALDQQPSTSLEGLVLTPFLEPVKDVLLELVVEGTRFGPVQSDATGRFQFDNLGAGAAELQLWLPAGNSSQAAPLTPLLTRRILLARGVHRSLDHAIILPLTKNRTTVLYDGTSEISLSLPGNSDFTLTIPPGAVRTRDGAEPSATEPILFSLTQVPTSSLPFRPSNGESPRIAWLLEPSDVEFSSEPILRIPDFAGLNGTASIGVYGLNTQGQRFDRQVGLVTDGAPVRFRNVSEIGGVSSGFSFVNAGYQAGLATVSSGTGGPAVPSGVEELDQ